MTAQRADINDRFALGDGFGIRIDVTPAIAQASLSQHFPDKIGFFAKSGIAAVADDFAGDALGDFAVSIWRHKNAAVGMAVEVNESWRQGQAFRIDNAGAGKIEAAGGGHRSDAAIFDDHVCHLGRPA